MRGMVKALHLAGLALLAASSASAHNLRGSSTREKLARLWHVNSSRLLQQDDEPTHDPAAEPSVEPTAEATAAPSEEDSTAGPATPEDVDGDGTDDDLDDDEKRARDIAVLQFALNLEYLEAEFYSWAAFGKGLPECAAGSIGGQKANLTAPYQALASELANNEIAHVRFLQTALGNNTVACPALDVGPAFAAAANAATNSTLDPPYSPYYDDKWFSLGAFIFEDVGVTAYNGASTLISSKAVLGAAASILAVEAYHAGAIRNMLTLVKDELLTPYTLTVAEGVLAVSDLRALVGGGKDVGILGNVTADSTPAEEPTAEPTTAADAVTVEPTAEPAASEEEAAAASSVVPVDDNALAFARNTTEILAIVTLGAPGNRGGFLPEGLTGTIV